MPWEHGLSLPQAGYKSKAENVSFTGSGGQFCMFTYWFKGCPDSYQNIISGYVSRMTLEEITT